MNAEAILESVLKCPECGHLEPEQMPTNSCVFYYECNGCGSLLRPEPGDCCVFCSFGSVPCPPVQKGDEPDCKPVPLNITGRKLPK